MSEKVYQAVAYIGLGVLALMVTVWIVISVPGFSGGDAAQWAQAVGSAVAILAAYFFGERQAQSMFNNELRIREVELKRKNGSILAIADEANTIALKVANIYRSSSPSRAALVLGYDSRATKDIIEALVAIPKHEVGSFDAVAALIRLKNSLVDLQRHIDQDIEVIDSGKWVDEALAQRRSDIGWDVRMKYERIQCSYGELQKALNAQKVTE
jgi:hypothetical protein